MSTGYADEVRELEARWTRVEPAAQEVRLAVKLVDALAGKFDPGKYRDEHRANLLEVIQAKAAGRQIAAPAERREPAKVVNLMEALRQSVEQVKKPLGKAEGPARSAGAKGKPAAAAVEARRARKVVRK